jgi:hypothetical protein
MTQNVLMLDGKGIAVLLHIIDGFNVTNNFTFYRQYPQHHETSCRG